MADAIANGNLMEAIVLPGTAGVEKDLTTQLVLDRFLEFTEEGNAKLPMLSITVTAEAWGAAAKTDTASEAVTKTTVFVSGPMIASVSSKECAGADIKSLNFSDCSRPSAELPAPCPKSRLISA